MIYLYTGTPGSGKSLRATREILLHLEKGRNVIANYPVIPTKKANRKGGKFYYWRFEEMVPEAFRKFARENHNFTKGRGDKSQTLIVIDECQAVFPSSGFRDKERYDWIGFFSKHRHLYFDVILIAPMDFMMDKQIRHLAEFELIHRNLSNFGFPGLLMKILHIRFFIAVCYNRSVKHKDGVSFFFLRKKDKKAYDSYLDFDELPVGPDADDAEAAESGNITEAAAPARTGGQRRGQGVPALLSACLRRLWELLSCPIHLPRGKCISPSPEISGAEGKE